MNLKSCRRVIAIVLTIVYSNAVWSGGTTYVAPSASAQKRLDALTQERNQIVADGRNGTITAAEQRFRLEENSLRRENVQREDMGMATLSESEIQSKARLNASASESQVQQIQSNNNSRATDSAETVNKNSGLYRQDDTTGSKASTSTKSAGSEGSQESTQTQASTQTQVSGGGTGTAIGTASTGGNSTGSGNAAGSGSSGSSGNSGSTSSSGGGSGSTAGYNSSNDGSNVSGATRENYYRSADGSAHYTTGPCGGGDICVNKVDTESGEIVASKMVKPGEVESTVKEMNGNQAPELVSTKTGGADGSTAATSTAGQAGQAAPISPAETNAAAGDIPAEHRGKGAATATPGEPPKPDATAAQKLSQAESADAALNTQIEAIKKQIAAVEPQATTEANTKCAASTTDPKLLAECASQLINVSLTCVKTNYMKLEAASKELAVQKKSCSSSSVQAEQLCSMVRSEKAQMVQQLMGVGAAVLSKVTAASESCRTTSGFSKLAQGGMLLAQGTCSAMKLRCDMTCASAQKSLTEMQVAAKALMACKLSALTATQAAGASLEAATTKLQTQLTQQLAPAGDVPKAIVQCEKHSVDVLAMGQAALGFLSAHEDAKKCQEQLTSGGSKGTSTGSAQTSSMTTAEYCAVPSNATSITCKCTSNPNAEGCMSNIATQGISLGKIGNANGASSFASAGGHGLGALKPGEKNAQGTAPGEKGLSAAAREIFGMDSSAASSGGLNGSAANTGANAAALEKGLNPADAARRSFNFSASSFGGAGGSGGAGRPGKGDASRGFADKLSPEEQKRRLASEQIRSEISSASGRSNFEKITNRYRTNFSSFEE